MFALLRVVRGRDSPQCTCSVYGPHSRLRMTGVGVLVHLGDEEALWRRRREVRWERQPHAEHACWEDCGPAVRSRYFDQPRLSTPAQPSGDMLRALVSWCTPYACLPRTNEKTCQRGSPPPPPQHTPGTLSVRDGQTGHSPRMVNRTVPPVSSGASTPRYPHRSRKAFPVAPQSLLGYPAGSAHS